MSRGGLLRWSRRCRLYRAADTAGRSTVVISICTPPFADRCIASLRCSRPTPGFFARFLSAAAGGGMDAVVRHTEAGGTFTHFTCESSPRKAPPGAGESDAVRRQRSQPVRRRRRGDPAGSLTRRCRRATKRRWTTSVEESIIKREGNLRLISRQTLKTSPRSRQGMRSPAGQRNVGWCRPGPLYPLSQRRGRHRPARRAVAPRRCPSSPATSLRKHHD